MPSRTKPFAILLAACVTALALLYGLVTPIFETPDEYLHFGFIRYLADNRSLPLQPPSVGHHEAGQEASQPPLYYIMVATITGWVNTGEYQIQDWLNPHRQLGNGLAYGNKNTAIHPPDEQFPFSGVPLAVHLGRIFSALMLGGTAFFTYLAGREVWPESPGKALTAAAMVGFLPSALFIAGGISNDNLVQVLAACGLWLSLRALRNGIGVAGAAVIGIIGGLAALSKLSGLAVLPLLVLAAAIGGNRRNKSWWLTGGLAGLIAVLLAGWWYLRNLILYGDPTGLNMMLDQVWQRPPGFSLLNLVEEWRFFRITFWGLFGTDNAMADDIFYQIGDLAVIVADIGLLLGLFRWVRRRHWNKGDAPVWAFLVAWLGLVVIAYIRWTLMNEANHGRHLFTALAPMAFLFVAGWTTLFPGKPGLVATKAFAVFLVVFALIAPFRYEMPAHAAIPVLAQGEKPGTGWTDLNYRYGDLLELVAVRTTKTDFLPGEWIDFDLLWEALGTTDRNSSVFLHLNRPDGSSVAQEDTYPGLGSRPTRYLKPGDTLSEHHRLFLPPNSSGPSALQLTIGVYELDDWERLDVTGDNGVSLPNAPLITTFVLRSPEQTVASQPLNVDFMDGIQLAGYEFAKEGDQVSGNLWWRVLAKPAGDYTEFLHAIALPSPIPLAQWDARPLAGNYPTLLWLPGTMIREPVTMKVPSTPSDDLRLWAGMYELSSGRRLLTDNGNDHVELGVFDKASGRFVPGPTD